MKNFYTKIYHTKVSLHENFQIYGTLKLMLGGGGGGGERLCNQMARGHIS